MRNLTQKELKSFREMKVKEQNNICPICKLKYDMSEFVVDHQHMTKKEILGENGAGLVRGVICRYCNSYLGKAENAFKRYGLHKRSDIISILRNMANFLEHNLQDVEQIVHPKEIKKSPKLGKRDFNKLNSLYKKAYPNKKPLEYPKSGKLTIKLKTLFEEFKLDISKYVI